MIQLNPSHPDPADPHGRTQQLAEEVVRPSFLRCMKDRDEFFDDFYGTLSDKAPGIGTMFAHVDMQRQNQLIRNAVEDLINYAVGNETAEQELRRLGGTHNRHGLNVVPELYDLWVDTIVETMRDHDPDADDDIDAAWRVVLRDGIKLMTSLY